MIVAGRGHRRPTYPCLRPGWTAARSNIYRSSLSRGRAGIGVRHVMTNGARGSRRSRSSVGESSRGTNRVWCSATCRPATSETLRAIRFTAGSPPIASSSIGSPCRCGSTAIPPWPDGMRGMGATGRLRSSTSRAACSSSSCLQGQGRRIVPPELRPRGGDRSRCSTTAVAVKATKRLFD